MNIQQTRLQLADYEAENLARLQKMFSRKWEFIFMQAEAQAKVKVFSINKMEMIMQIFRLQKSGTNKNAKFLTVKKGHFGMFTGLHLVK